MMLLVYDVETTGLTDHKLPADHPSQPRMCTLSALMCEDDGRYIQGIDLRVRPDGWLVPDEIAKIHGLTTEILKATGVPIVDVMTLFEKWVRMADLRIAHNIVFDNKIYRGEARRLGLEDHFDKSKDFCTMWAAKKLMKLAPTPAMLAANFRTSKQPKLGEAYEFFTGKKLEKAHQGLADVHACKLVYLGILGHELYEAPSTAAPRAQEAMDLPGTDPGPAGDLEAF